MTPEKVSVLGDVFEFAFKLGFLKDKIEDYERFKKRGFGRILCRMQENNLEEFLRAWEEWQDILPYKVDKLRNLGLEPTDRNKLMFLVLCGYYGGHFSQGNFEKIDFIKYDLGEESQVAGVYQNADLLFIADGILHVVDFKLGGAEEDIGLLLDKKIGRIPYRVYGLPLNISLGEIGFERFLTNLLQIEEELLSLRYASPELKGFLQVISYAVDYLCEESPKGVREVSLSIYYPLAEPFSARFYWNGEDLSFCRERIRKLYEEVKDVDWEYSKASAKDYAIREMLLEKVPKEIQELKRKMHELENSQEVIATNKVPREHVVKVFEEFLSKPEDIKALCLLHSAGSGKTSTVREGIKEMKGKHIVLYMATRKVLVEREYKELTKEPLGLVYEKRQSKSSMYVRHIGDAYEDTSSSKGILERTVNRIWNLKRKGVDKIWAFCTQQALVENQYGQSTSKHLGYLADGSITGEYRLHFILDEFLGYSNGLFAIEEMLKLLKEVKEKEGKANLYLFDANGYSPILFKKLLEEYKEFKVMPESLVLVDFKEEETIDYDGIKIYAFAQHGYPAKEIHLRRKFLFLNKREELDELVKGTVSYIKQTFTFEEKESQTAFLFLQDKEVLAKLKKSLEREGYSCLVATADSRKSQERINQGTEDIILSTSALSRGINLSRPHKPVNKIYAVVLDFGIEANLVELIQAISRARGDKNTEETAKELYFVYPVYLKVDYFFEKILRYEPSANEEILRLLIEKHTLNQKLLLDKLVLGIVKQFVKGGREKALVPLPSQYRTRYIPNEVRDLEGLLSFLENIAPYVEDEEKQKKIMELRDTLLMACSVSAEQINFKTFEYYHPYILVENQAVRYSFDNRKREKILRLFNELERTLGEQNPEKTKELKDFIQNILHERKAHMPVLIPVYAFVITEHFLKDKEKCEFRINSRVGRGGADTLMGSVQPVSYCFMGTEKEYACVPLGEDYPYKEVLSGRFAKFPIEFIINLLEGSQDGA